MPLVNLRGTVLEGISNRKCRLAGARERADALWASDCLSFSYEGPDA